MDDIRLGQPGSKTLLDSFRMRGMCCLSRAATTQVWRGDIAHVQLFFFFFFLFASRCRSGLGQNSLVSWVQFAVASKMTEVCAT